MYKTMQHNTIQIHNIIKEHNLNEKDIAIFQHFYECEAWKDIADLFQIYGYQIDERQSRINCVRDNIRRSGDQRPQTRT